MNKDGVWSQLIMLSHQTVIKDFRINLSRKDAIQRQITVTMVMVRGPLYIEKAREFSQALVLLLLSLLLVVIPDDIADFHYISYAYKPSGESQITAPLGAFPRTLITSI